MTNENLDGYIQLLNAGQNSESIFTRNLSSSVVWAKVWEKVPDPKDEPDPYIYPYTMFFIKNQQNTFVGVVLDMGCNDLHWYIQKVYRKKGYLTRALMETILPFIFYEERDTQKLTIDYNQDHYEDSKRVAINTGFKAVNEQETEFELSHEDFDGNEYIIGDKEGISEARNLILQKRISYLSNLLRMISTELELKFYDDFGLQEIVKQLAPIKMVLEDHDRVRQQQNKKSSSRKK